MAIALIEARDDLDVNPPIKIFATDVHNGSLVKGREGVYTDEEVAGLNPERLARFFRKEAGGWRAKPELRGTIAFSNHNLLMDAPFTRIDLMSCRNTLIYFTQKSQRNAFWAFGFALRNGGTLMLGESEALGVAAPDFAEIAPPSRLFRKLRHRTTAGFKRIRRPSEIRPVAAPLHAFDTNRSATGSGRGRSTSTDRTINTAHEAVYAAEGVGALLISESKQLMQVLGEASEWLEFPSGPPPDDVMRLIKDVALRGAVGSVFRRLGDEEAPEEVVSLRNGDASRQVVLRGLHIRDGEATHALVYAKPHVVIGLSEFAGVEGTDVLNADHLRAKVAQLESDLEVMTRQLQTSVQQQESTYDEVSAANEQLVVSNEELQTSIEELSSVNEELRTVADEHEHRLQEVLELGADLEQSLDATNIGLILLNADLVIRRFSKPATNFFHLISSDVGRPFNHIRAQFVCEI